MKTERIGDVGSYVRGPIGTKVGQTIAYLILVTNTGNVELTVKLTDRLCDSGTLHAHGTTTLPPGGSVTYTCSHRLFTADASPLVNTATATAVTTSGTTVGPVSSQVAANRLNGVLGAFKKVKAKAKPAKPVVAPARFTG